MPSKVVRLNVRVEPELLREIDWCVEHIKSPIGVKPSRSDIIRVAVQDYTRKTKRTIGKDPTAE